MSPSNTAVSIKHMKKMCASAVRLCSILAIFVGTCVFSSFPLSVFSIGFRISLESLSADPFSVGTFPFESSSARFKSHRCTHSGGGYRKGNQFDTYANVIFVQQATIWCFETILHIQLKNMGTPADRRRSTFRLDARPYNTVSTKPAVQGCQNTDNNCVRWYWRIYENGVQV